jgi:histidinol-phosphate/aromatic aminotransferase/cobyric acid decarboxylase-like protein
LRIGYAVVGSEIAQTLAEPPRNVSVTRLAQAAALALVTLLTSAPERVAPCNSSLD